MSEIQTFPRNERVDLFLVHSSSKHWLALLKFSFVLFLLQLSYAIKVHVYQIHLIRWFLQILLKLYFFLFKFFLQTLMKKQLPCSIYSKSFELDSYVNMIFFNNNLVIQNSSEVNDHGPFIWYDSLNVVIWLLFNVM